MNEIINDQGLENRLNKLEPSYQSEGERHIGRILDRYGIPFFYEQPTIIYDQGRRQIWFPDFTLPTYNGLLVEYADERPTADRESTIQRQKRVYHANDIPAVFVYPMDLAKPNADEKLYERIKKTYEPDFPDSQLYQQ